MPGLIMQCTACGHRFESRAFKPLRPGSTLRVHNNAEECPLCRSPSLHTEEGLFVSDHAGQWWRIAEELTAPGMTILELQSLAKIISTAQAVGSSPEVLAGAISSQLPQFPSVAAALLSDKGMAVATWAGVLLQVIFWIITFTADPAPSEPAPAPTVIVNVQAPTTEQVRKVIDETLKENDRREREEAAQHRHKPSR